MEKNKNARRIIRAFLDSLKVSGWNAGYIRDIKPMPIEPRSANIAIKMIVIIAPIMRPIKLSTKPIVDLYSYFAFLARMTPTIPRIRPPKPVVNESISAMMPTMSDGTCNGGSAPYAGWLYGGGA